MVRSLSLLLVFLILVGCEWGREGELTGLWREAVQADTVDAYVSFLAEQKPGENVDVGSVTPFGDDAHDRSRVARRRMFEIAFAAAHNTCPFGVLHVDLRQNIKGVSAAFDFQRSGPGRALVALGVQLTETPGSADATLIVELNGEGINQQFVSQSDFSSTINAVTAGKVQGALWFANRPDAKVGFEGEGRGRAVVAENYRPPSGDVPEGIQDALEDAGFENKLATLVYDRCGAAAAAFVYFGREVAGRDASKSVEEDLERRLAADREDVHALTIAMAFGVGQLYGLSELSYPSSEKALRFLTTSSPADQGTIALAWSNTFHHWTKPEWLVVPALKDGE